MTQAQVSASKAAFDLQSVHFDFPNGQAIHLKDPATDLFVGESPEWVEGQAPRPVAYVRGVTPQIQAVFRGTSAANGDYLIGASGTLLGITQRRVTLAFDTVSGLSTAISFTFEGPLPDVIGIHAVGLDWYACDPATPALRREIGTSAQSLCTTWRPMAPNADRGLENWVYSPIAVWTSEWAAGATDEKQICDEVIKKLHLSGLQYGLDYREVREMLQNGGGMCRGWYLLFQQMCHCQGVFVHRRAFLVHRRTVPPDEIHWCALAVRHNGLNQAVHPEPEADYRDHDIAFPGLGAPLALRTESRYRFWGEPLPGFWGDGHGINLLEFGGDLFLYDASFGRGPFKVDPPLPPTGMAILGGLQLASFKAAYLDQAVDYMMGSLYNGGHFYEADEASDTNGITVKTSMIPTQIGRNPGITFGWSE